MNLLLYTIFVILTTNNVYADYLQCYVCEDCEENDGYLEYCPPLEELDLMLPASQGTTATTGGDMDIPAQAASTTSNTTAVVDSGDDSTIAKPTAAFNSNETNNLTALLGSNSTAKPTTTTTIELETLAEIDDAPMSTQIYPEINDADDFFGNNTNIANLDPEFYRPTVNSDNNTTADLNSTEIPELQVTQTTNNESVTVLNELPLYTTEVDVPTTEVNGLTTYLQGVAKPVINITEATNMTNMSMANSNEVAGEQDAISGTTPPLATLNVGKENLTSFESLADILTNKTSNANVDVLTDLINGGEGNPTNISFGEDEILTDSEEMDFSDVNSTFTPGLQSEISTANGMEDNFMRPVGATVVNMSTIFANETTVEPENTTFELDLVVKNSTKPENPNVNATVPLELAGGVFSNMTSFVRPNSTSQADLSSDLFGNATTSFETEQSLGTLSENNLSAGTNLTNLESDLLGIANDASENITIGVQPSDIIQDVSLVGSIGNLLIAEALNASGIKLDPAMRTTSRPLNPINSTPSFDVPANVFDLLELMKPQSGLLVNPLTGGKFRRSTSTNLKQESTQSRYQNPTLVSKYQESRASAQIQRGNITYKCYTVRVKGENNMQINKGCLAVPAERAALKVLVNKYGLEALEDYQVCSENKCNRSSSVGLRFAAKSLIFIMFVAWLFH